MFLIKKVRKNLYIIRYICFPVFFFFRRSIWEFILLPVFFLITLCARFRSKPIDVGIGPEPLINNVYHKKALKMNGFSVETFVNQVYFITSSFDVRADKCFKGCEYFIPYFLYLRIIFKYKIIYIYFNGGPLAWSGIYKHFEPFFYRLAKVKVVVMPYGGDIQDILLSHNLLFRNSLGKDYPLFQKKCRSIIIQNVEKWTNNADYVISGCDWVHYMYHWDKLMLGYFSIDTDVLCPVKIVKSKKAPVKILHAPNHKNIKGTDFFIRAVDELKEEGYSVELVLIQKMPNEKVKELMQEADIIADQLIIGWYAMTALEAMCYEKPVLCYLDPDLVDLYHAEGLISGPDELPLVNCSFKNVKEKIKWLIDNPKKRLEIGKKGREFAIKHHSLSAVGKVFKEINDSLLR